MENAEITFKKATSTFTSDYSTLREAISSSLEFTFGPWSFSKLKVDPLIIDQEVPENLNIMIENVLLKYGVEINETPEFKPKRYKASILRKVSKIRKMQKRIIDLWEFGYSKIAEIRNQVKCDYKLVTHTIK